MDRECDVWRTDDIVEILCKIGVDKLLTNTNILFTGVINNIVRKKVCDFSENSLKELHELKFLLILRLKLNSLELRVDDCLPGNEELAKLCCVSLRSGTCNEIHAYFPLLSDILVKCLLLMNCIQYREFTVDQIQECKCNLLATLSGVRLSFGDWESLPVSNHSHKIIADCVILESLVESLQLSKNTANSEFEDIFEFLSEESLCEAVIKLTTCGLRDVVLHTLTSLVPKLGVFNHSIFSKLWSEICNNLKPNDDTTTTWKLLCLCALADYYFPSSNINDRFVNIISNTVLWKLFQEGLVHTDSTVRKQALYLMKRTIDGIMRHKLVVHSSSGKQTLFWWQPCFQDELVSMWQKYFVVLETLEETQVHLVRPIMQIIDELVPKSTAVSSDNAEHLGLHITWVMCIFERILHHDNSLIIKWGIVSMNCHKVHFVSNDNECLSKILITFVQALNNSSLYALTQEECSTAQLKAAVEGILTSVVKLPPHKARDIFMHILRVVNKIQWGPVPLFYFCHTLACVPRTETKVLNSESVYLLDEFIRNALGNQNVFIRGGVQCFLIQAITILLDSRNVGLLTIANILDGFRSRESLKRGTCAWNVVVEWLKTFIDVDVAENFVVGGLVTVTSRAHKDLHITESCLARIMVLLWDSHCLPSPFDNESSSTGKHLLKLVNTFQGANKRLYANIQVQETCLKLLVSLLEESEQLKSLPDDRVRKIVLSLVGMCISGVIVFILRRLVSLLHLADYDTTNFLASVMSTFSKSSELFPSLYKELKLLQTTAISILCRDDPPIRKYFASHMLLWTLEFIEVYSEETLLKAVLVKQHEEFLLKVITEGLLNSVPVKDNGCGEVTRDSNNIWGRVVSGYVRNIWSVLATFLRVNTDVSSAVLGTAAASIFNTALDCVQLGGKDILPPLLEVIGHFLSRTTSESLESVSRLLSLCWKTLFELRKTELFWHAFKAFVNAVFTESVLENTLLLPMCVQYAHNILNHGDNIPKLPNVLLQRLNDEVHRTSIHILDPFMEVLAEALIFGPVHRKDLRVVNDTCDYIESLGSQLSVNVLQESDCQANNKVRALAVGLLLHLINSPDGYQTAFRVMEYLKERDKVASAQKPFYHKDSQLHRLKHRVLQVLLILEPVLSLVQSKEMVQWLCNCLLCDNPQPSVRYQQEWLLVLLLHRHPQLCDSLWDLIQKALEMRTGSMCSYISVLFHVACSLSHNQEQFVDRTMQEILPCIMGHHFIVRTYAKVALMKLFKLCKEQQFDHLVFKYSVVEKALHLRLEQGNAVRTLDKLLDEFYFSVFNPVHHYTMETIFYDLPRLANVTHEEWIPASVFESVLQFPANTVPLKNSDSCLRQFSVADWIVKSTAQDESGSLIQTQVTVQKKIIPWKSMIPNQDDSMKARVEGGLVVVASLIDRSPNLGGLSRTCEVFGVSQYVLGSLKYAEDKQFQNLSVNADKWINMLEVKPHMLPQYMQGMKQDGYLVVGIEQTTNSTRLEKLKFPKKSLLVLGNEKEGIPANLLPLMDVCVEVPQYGLTRSLNVHVTGAIIIWEYYKQHLIGT